MEHRFQNQSDDCVRAEILLGVRTEPQHHDWRRGGTISVKIISLVTVNARLNCLIAEVYLGNQASQVLTCDLNLVF